MKHCATIRFLVFAHLFGCSLHITESLAANSATPIVSRAAFLLETDKDNPGISPDGAFVSFTATSKGAEELWIAPTTSPHTTKRIATIEEGALSGYFWTSDSSRILCLVQGKDGSYRLDSVEIQSGSRRNIMVSRSRISFFGVSPSQSSKVAIGCPHRAAK